MSTNAGWPGDVAVAVEVLFSMKEEAKQRESGDVGELKREEKELDSALGKSESKWPRKCTGTVLEAHLRFGTRICSVFCVVVCFSPVTFSCWV